MKTLAFILQCSVCILKDSYVDNNFKTVDVFSDRYHSRYTAP